ncbi:DUF3224 domain-containing protein [Nocardia acidivorans]|uniref:DUF3224 domain-containing protein n=1 Tax=Nocardia acidivorans TaxID=404580 RepID=UPI0035A25550
MCDRRAVRRVSPRSCLPPPLSGHGVLRSLNGRAGAFAFGHSATTTGTDRSAQFFIIVPGSGTGELAGITGAGSLDIEAAHTDFATGLDPGRHGCGIRSRAHPSGGHRARSHARRPCPARCRTAVRGLYEQSARTVRQGTAPARGVRSPEHRRAAHR